MADAATEQVLVVPTSRFQELGYFQGFSREVERYLPALLRADQVSYRPRAAMEIDPGFKQLIPYVIFRHLAADQRPHLFQYVRGKGQGEARLHSKRSIGIGGHISHEDHVSAGSAGERNPYEEGMQRELQEEVQIDTPFRQQIVGLINDDLTEVGRVHLGIVHLVDVERPRVYAREQDIADAGFRPLDELLQHRDGFETWSQICLAALFG